MKHGLHAWMAGVIGVCGLCFLQAAKLDTVNGVKLKAMPHLWFAGAWSFFIYNHKQPNDYGVMMHWAATAWVLVGGFLRLLRNRGDGDENIKEAGVAYIMAAYTFFGGQLGLTKWAEEQKANVGSYVLIWHVIPISVVLLYIKVFVGGSNTNNNRDGGEGGGPKTTQERSRLLDSDV